MISESLLPLLLFLLCASSFLYASVGHGGASAYLAIMLALGMPSSITKPSALLMNTAVSFLSFMAFRSSGHFRFKLFFPFALSSVPMAYLGAQISLPDHLYKKTLAVCLLFAIFRLLYKNAPYHLNDSPKNDPSTDLQKNSPPLWATLLSGGLIGLLSGMIGIGGGILLSPLLLLMHWATLKETAAVSALFIFVNSLAGLYALMIHNGLYLSTQIKLCLLAALFGGLLGSYFGSTKFHTRSLHYLLATGLGIASLKLFFV